jgi:hypothetical protein
MGDTAESAPSRVSRFAGVVQVVGGTLEVTLGAGAAAVPTGQQPLRLTRVIEWA